MPCGSSKDSCNQDKNGHCAFEDLDHAVLQQPLNLGVTNIKQILKCVQSGSREVKDIILNECNIIYECKACVGLFRSLANFMYHKRCYCKKHLCEGMLLFEKFDEEEIITVQPEAPKENLEENIRGITNMTDCTVDLVKSDIVQEMNSDAPMSIEMSSKAKEGNPSSNNKEKSKSVTESEKLKNPMMSRRTRDKIAQTPSPSSTSKIVVKAGAPEEPPLKCVKIITSTAVDKDTGNKSSAGNKDNQLDTSNKEIKTKKFEVTKFTGNIDKSSSPFPKIIFKTIDSNPHAVFQSNDKKKIETFGIGKYEAAAVETKVDNDKLIIVLKKDVKPENKSDSKPLEANKPKTEAEKATGFHLTRRNRLMARNDCDVRKLKCLVCKTHFMSLKTLYFHMLSLHSKKRLYYPCPCCKTLFVQMYGVTRHLISIHNKTKEQINKLKDVIKRKSVWKKVDDLSPTSDKTFSTINYQIKSTPEEEEIKPKALDSENDEQESLKTVIKLGKNAVLHQCAKCNRVFGRKSSQVSHQKFCIMNLNAVKSEGSEPSSPVKPPTSPVVSFLSLSPNKSPASQQQTSSLRVEKPESNEVKLPVAEKQTPDVKISIRPKRGAEKQMHKDFVNSQTLKWRSANRIETHVNTHVTTKNVAVKKSNGKNLEKKVLGIMDAETLTCLKCDKKFSSYSNLRRHVAIHIGWTRFKCKYCEYQAYNKSQCWAHVQKAHSIDSSDIDKAIVNLGNNTASITKKMIDVESQSSKDDVEIIDPIPKMNNSPKSPISKMSNPLKGPISKMSNPAKSPISKLSNPSKSPISKMSNPVKSPVSKISNPSKVKISKKKNINIKNINSDKKQQQSHKKDVSESKKEIKAEKEPEEQKNEPTQIITLPKIARKEISETKKKPQATISFQKFPKKEILEYKKDKPQHIIPIQKITMPETNYKSVTTSNPTTIILSKKIPSSTVQSIVTISPQSLSSTSKISSIRTSPRKNEIKEPGEKLITTLVTRSSAYSKTTPIQIKLPSRSNSIDDVSKDSTDKNCSRKERLISEWFPKKELSPTISSVRRESAPLIIGLVPAANTGMNARGKSTPGSEKPSS